VRKREGRGTPSITLVRGGRRWRILVGIKDHNPTGKEDFKEKGGIGRTPAFPSKKGDGDPRGVTHNFIKVIEGKGGVSICGGERCKAKKSETCKRSDLFICWVGRGKIHDDETKNA